MPKTNRTTMPPKHACHNMHHHSYFSFKLSATMPAQKARAKKAKPKKGARTPPPAKTDTRQSNVTASPIALAETFMPFVNRRAFILYDESDKTRDAEVHAYLLIPVMPP